MPPISDTTLASISDSSNTNTRSQNDVFAVERSIFHLITCIDRLEHVRHNEYAVTKARLVNWESKLKTVFDLSATLASPESTECSQQLYSSITKDLDNIQKTICGDTWSLSRALIDTRHAFAGLWDSLLKHSAQYATDQILRHSCYIVLVYSMGHMNSVIDWVKEITYQVGTASNALWTWPHAYKLALNEIHQILAFLRHIFQQENTVALPQQLPVDTVSMAVRHIKESIGHDVPVPDVIVEGVHIKLVWPDEGFPKAFT